MIKTGTVVQTLDEVLVIVFDSGENSGSATKPDRPVFPEGTLVNIKLETIKGVEVIVGVWRVINGFKGGT